MSASWSGSMRGPRVKTPFLLLLLLLLLLSALTGTVLCQDYDDGGDPGAEGEEETVVEEATPVEDAPPVEEENGDEETSESSASSADPDTSPTMASTDEGVPEESVSTTTITTSIDDGGSGSGETLDSTADPFLEDGLNPIIILIPVVLVVVIIGMIVCGIFINRRWKKKASNQELGKEDPYLDGSSTEKVPISDKMVDVLPMFEEDVPSVLELEMEELDQWMKKDDDSNHA